MDQEKSEYINELQKNIKRYNRLNTVEAYSLKAEDLMKLGKLTKDKSYIQQAIDSWNQAISKRHNPIYLCNRAMAHNQIGETQKAMQDFRSAYTLSLKNQQSDILKKIHLNNLMQGIAKIDQIKALVQSMKQKNELSSDFINNFSRLTSTTQRIILNISANQQNKNQSAQIISKLTSKIQQLQKKITQKLEKQNIAENQQSIKKYLEVFNQLQEKSKYSSQCNVYKLIVQQFHLKIQHIQKNAQQLDRKIQKVQIAVNNLIHHNEVQFNQIKNKIKKVNGTIDGFHGKFKVIQGEVNSQNQKLIFMNEQLKKGLYPKNQVKDQMQKWKQEDNVIYEYAHNFYWILNNYLLSYRVASTGMFDGKQPNPSFFQTYFSKCVNAIASGLSLLPVIGNAVELIKTIFDTIFEQYKDKKFNLMVKKMNSLTKYVLEEDMSLAVGKGVIELCKMSQKAEEIRYFSNKIKLHVDRNALVEAKEKFDQEIESLIQKANGYNVKEHNIIYKLVIEDIVALIGYIMVEQISDENPIENAIIKAFKGGSNSEISKLLLDRYQPNNPVSSSQSENNCIVYRLNIQYDNEIMNRNYLFDFLVKKYDVDKIIFLGKKVSTELIEEAFQTENYDLIKAACMSLDVD